MIRLIGIDIDGTLLDGSGVVSKSNQQAIEKVVALGVHVALVTGRTYSFARPIANHLPPEITLIVSNGAVERSITGKTLARRLLPRQVAQRVLRSMQKYRQAAALIFDRDDARQLLFESMDWDNPNRKGYWARNKSLIDQCTPLEDALTEDPIQVMFNGSVADMRLLVSSLEGGADFAVALTEYKERDFCLVDITAPSATKGHALKWRAEHLGLKRDEIMAIGDNLNDLDMLEFAGLPVVMGNAVQSLKERGWFITGSHEQSGVATALNQFVLNQH